MSVAFLLCMMVYKWEWVASSINYLMTFWFYPALIIIFSSGPVAKLFNHKFIGILGKITYDTYIWHNPNFLLLYYSGHYRQKLELAHRQGYAHIYGSFLCCGSDFLLCPRTTD